MSMKAKLSFSISIIVAIILILNIVFYYASSEQSQEDLMEQRVHAIAKQIGVTIETVEKSRQFMGDELGKKLYMAALVAKERLDPDINHITNEQLVKLKQELGLDDITLWQRIDGDVVTTRSSNPDEIGLNSATWDYWNVAFQQLFDKHRVTIPEGQKLPNYWSGPMNYATSNSAQINKWGYYYDGTTNYMINTIVNTLNMYEYDYLNGTNSVISKILAERPALLEVTGFNPEFFGKTPIIKIKKGIPVYNLDVRDVSFGQYTYKDPEDSVHLQQVLNTGELLTVKSKISGHRVIKSFIPIVADKTYVIGLTFDHNTMQQPIKDQLLIQALISLGLVIFTMISSYFIAGYMMRSLNQILFKVNAIAAGNFQATINIQNKDELGLLAARVNSMGRNLLEYTTQLKNTASELRNTKQYLESFFNHTSDAIHVVDLDGIIIQVNNAFETIFGWQWAEVVGSALPNIPEEHQAAYKDIIAIIMNGGSVTDYETVRYTKSGEVIDISMTVSAIRDEQEEIIAIATISRNITLRKQTEEMILRSEKLSIVGQLAAGVAHEVRNPLTTLRGFVQYQKQTGSLTPAHLDLMLEELDQINMIVSEFLVIAKPQANNYSSLDVYSLVSGIMLLLDSEAKQNHVELELLSETDVPAITGVADQLKQVFINIVKNGIEAMPNGGKLTAQIAGRGGNEVVIQFTDEGSGIPEEDMRRLGEPFFTRKPHGSGLGVMVSQQIIANHNGRISFHSKAGEGTRVEISLPVTDN